MPTIVDLYCRVSTDEQVRDGYSLDVQQKRLRLYAESMGWIVNRCYVDGGYSGKNMDRPGMQAMILDAKQGTINKVCVCMLDRLSRSQKDTMWFIEDICLANNVDFVSMHETLDTSTPVGRAMIGVLAVFAQLERDQITERLAIGRNERVKAGIYKGGGVPPMGYTYDAAHDTLVIDPAPAAAVQNVFRLFLAGTTLGRIADALNADPSLPRINYTASQVRRIIDNPIYIGRMRWKGEIIDMANPVPLVDAETFAAAQAIRARTKRTSDQTSVVSATLLSGLLYCGVCGRRYTYCDDPKMNKNRKRRYVCSSHRSFSKRQGIVPCESRSIVTDVLDDIIISEIRAIAADRSLIDQQYKQENARQNELTYIGRRIIEIDNQLSRLIDLFMLGKFDTKALTARTDSLTQEREALIAKREALSKDVTTDTSAFDEALSQFESLVDTVHDKKDLSMLIRALIRRITITGDTTTISWNFR